MTIFSLNFFLFFSFSGPTKRKPQAMVKPSSRLEDEFKEEEVEKIEEGAKAEPQAVENDLLENQGPSKRFSHIVMWGLAMK